MIINDYIVLINIIIMTYLNKLIPKGNLKGPMSQLVNMEKLFLFKVFVGPGITKCEQRAQSARHARGGKEKISACSHPIVPALSPSTRPKTVRRVSETTKQQFFKIAF